MESDIILKIEKNKTGLTFHQLYDQRNGFRYPQKTLKSRKKVLNFGSILNCRHAK